MALNSAPEWRTVIITPKRKYMKREGKGTREQARALKRWAEQHGARAFVERKYAHGPWHYVH